MDNHTTDNRLKAGQVIDRLSQHSVAEELQEALTTAARASIDRKGKSTVSLTLELKPNGEGGVEISASIGLKTPKKTHARTFLFVDREGHLSVTDPSQLNLGKELER